jgi:hypothetical protein
MMYLASSILGGENIFGSFGLWAFLSVGAVSLFGVFLPITTWLDARRRESEAFYKAESLRRVTETSTDGAKASIEYLREQARLEQLKTVEGMKVGGLILTGVGIGIGVMLWLIVGRTFAACGLIPMLLGLAMLAYVTLFAKPIV